MITCGCGFTAQQGSVQANQDAYDSHECRPPLRARWWETLLDSDTLTTLGVMLGVFVVVIVGIIGMVVSAE